MEKQRLNIEDIIERIENNELTVDAGLLYTNFLKIQYNSSNLMINNGGSESEQKNFL